MENQEISEMVSKLEKVKEYDLKLFSEISRLIDNSLELKTIRENLLIGELYIQNRRN